MKRFICSVCGYVHEGDTAPEECPVCHQPGTKFREDTQASKMGVHLPGDKETAKIAALRGKQPGEDIQSPSRFPEITSKESLKEMKCFSKRVKDFCKNFQNAKQTPRTVIL